MSDPFGTTLLTGDAADFTHDLAAYRGEYDDDGQRATVWNFGNGIAPRTSWTLGMVCDLPRGSKILDVGCRTGETLLPLAYLWRYDLYGVELVQRFVDVCRQRGLNVQQGFAEALPWPDETFDGVILTEILEHVIDAEVVLTEALRVLKPGGLVVVSFPYGPWHLGLPENERDHHVREINPNVLTTYGHDFLGITLKWNFAWAQGHDHGTHCLAFHKYVEPPFVRPSNEPVTVGEALCSSPS